MSNNENPIVTVVSWLIDSALIGGALFVIWHTWVWIDKVWYVLRGF